MTERDLAIFGTLGRYRYLRSTYLHAFVGGKSLTRFKERLGDLFHEGYLDRPTAQWLLPDSRYVPVVYELGRVAEHVLTTVGAGQFDKATWLGGRMHRQFAHSVMICECLASIELETKLNAVRFIPWSEILARSPDATRRSAQPFRISISNNLGVVPDAIFGLEYDVQGKRLYRFFALEVDRATMPIRRSACDQSSYLAKLAAYREVTAKQVYRARLNLPNLLVLTVTTNERRMKTIMDGLGNEGAPIFLFKWFDEVSRRPGPLLSGAWKRCGLPPLDLTAAG